MAQLFSLSGQTLVNGSGVPYAAAKASFFETGTTTPKATYSNAGLTSANSNPVVADADGRFPDIYLVAGRYKVVLATSADVAIDTLDPVDATSQLISQSAAPAATYPFLRYHNTTDGNVYRRNAANSAWINEGPVDSLISGATVSEVLTGTATDKAVTPDALAGLWQRGADIASASTLSLPAGGGGVFNVTGTTTINGISSAQGGRMVTLRFSGALTLTHNGSSFILPGAVPVPVKAGDVAEFTNDAAADASGSNWRMTSFLSASDPVTTQISAKTAGYTVVATDRNGLIRFSGLSGDATLSLPAASGNAGFMLYIRNDDTTHGVIVDPNGAELIDGVATRRTNGPNTITIICDGTGWRTISGSYLFRSAGQTVAASGLLQVAHGLGLQPRRVWYYYVCVSSSGGFGAGEEVFLVDTDAAGGAGPVYGYSFYTDATNVNVRAGSGATVFVVINKTTGAATSISGGALANWNLIICADAP